MYFRTGDQVEALRCTARILQIISDYDNEVFDLYWNSDVKPATLMAALDSDTRALQSYLRYLLNDKASSLDEIASLWNWLAAHNGFSESDAAQYVNSLAERHLLREAAHAWLQYTSMHQGYLDGNHVYNGDFERTPSGAVFDWRLQKRNWRWHRPDG